MDIPSINKLLSKGKIDNDRIFPHLDDLKKAPFVFEIDFGLKELPKGPGILLIRGARQYGKSTWLEWQLCETIKRFGRSPKPIQTCLYLSKAGQQILVKDYHVLV